MCCRQILADPGPTGKNWKTGPCRQILADPGPNNEELKYWALGSDKHEPILGYSRESVDPDSMGCLVGDSVYLL